MRFLRHPFLFIVFPLCVLAIAFSFYRFIIKADYIVSYEGDCDPTTQACFVGYDEDTQENYYYTKVHKYAPDAYADCGADITGCETANVCLLSDRDCAVLFCSPKTALKDETCDQLDGEATSSTDL